MKLILDIQDNKAEFIMELLGNFNFVKTEPLSVYKAEVLENVKQGVEEMNLINQGKGKGISAKDLLDEL
ncbi:hypothetical protein [Aureibacter tunicatorum]|uniref:Uncharacterized protein n=1 Tax=Aureibacter tunicatorum TaxID=866807 RepID=A0AAE3XTH5_9BACT|nr:hypothetical protein [Aureibacter tunicatorum]MDR6241793.1 hypothetical protein [Aureibacter tunicatorum]BDD07415.1 hypothetical protein AUTU_48980 [Aureibacter tunicatorum]